MKDVCIATITWARTADEETLLRQSLQELSKHDIPVYITDGGSNAGFINFIKGLPNMHLVQANEKGLWAQAKNSLHAARSHGSPFILYSEPDKLNFFQYHLQAFIASSQLNEDDGVRLASRSAKGFATFPSFQQMTETTINHCCAEATGHPLDFTYGPFIMNSRLVQYCDQLPADIGWGWRPFVFVMAHRMGLSISDYMQDFFCPPDQQEDDATERLYRMKQLEQNIRGIVLASSIQL